MRVQPVANWEDSTRLEIVAFINFVTDAGEPQNLMEIKAVGLNAPLETLRS